MLFLKWNKIYAPNKLVTLQSYFHNSGGLCRNCLQVITLYGI